MFQVLGQQQPHICYEECDLEAMHSLPARCGSNKLCVISTPFRWSALKRPLQPAPYFPEKLSLRSNTMADPTNEQIVKELQTAYWMELETVMNYLANSINLDGVRAEEIKKALAADVSEELTHAQALARRIKTIGGQVPGSRTFAASQELLQPVADSTDVASVIKGVIAAEDAAIAQYNKIIRLCDGVDYVTQDLCIQSLADEEQHRRDFVGYLTEYEKRGS